MAAATDMVLASGLYEPFGSGIPFSTFSPIGEAVNRAESQGVVYTSDSRLGEAENSHPELAETCLIWHNKVHNPLHRKTGLRLVAPQWYIDPDTGRVVMDGQPMIVNASVNIPPGRSADARTRLYWQFRIITAVATLGNAIMLDDFPR